MIQPSPAQPMEAFQAASVYMQGTSVLGGGSWLMLGGLSFGFIGEIWARDHSLASRIAFDRVSSGEKSRFWKVNWFLTIHKFQQIEAVSVPGPSPTRGSDGILLMIFIPALVFLTRSTSIDVASGASFQTFLEYGQVKSKWETVSSSLQREHLIERGMFLTANCSPTGRASWRAFHRNTFIFSDVLISHTFADQSIDIVGFSASSKSRSSNWAL